MGPRWIILPFATALVAGCAQFPQLDGTISDSARNAPYPELVPIESIRAGVPPEQITPQTAPEIEARAARLRARAARLRRLTIDS